MGGLYYGCIIVVLLLSISAYYYFIPLVLSTVIKTDGTWIGSGFAKDGRSVDVSIVFSNLRRIQRKINIKLEINFSTGASRDVRYDIEWTSADGKVKFEAEDMVLSDDNGKLFVSFNWSEKPFLISKRASNPYVVPFVLEQLLSQRAWLGKNNTGSKSGPVQISLAIKGFTQTSNNTGSVYIAINISNSTSVDALNTKTDWLLTDGVITFAKSPGTSINYISGSNFIIKHPFGGMINSFILSSAK